ncbi:MAG: GDSL-type esterase/lipase family protein [Ilumatobacteraceae bacterium]
MLSRRQILSVAAAIPATAILGEGQASAAVPFIRTDFTVREFGPALFIGDSTTSGYRSNLVLQLRDTTLGPYRFDLGPVRSMTKSTRVMYSGVEAVRRARAAGFEPKVVVFGVGANDLRYGIRTPELARQAFDPLVGEAGPDVTVGILNLYSPRATRSSRIAAFNRYLEEATTRWPNLVIVDWASLARRNRRWHKADGVHYNMSGARHRNTFMIQSLIDVCVKHDELNPPEPPPV